MTYTNSYTDWAGLSRRVDSSSEIVASGSRSPYRYFWEVRRDASSNSVTLALATDDEPPYIDSRVNMTDHVRHGQHQDTGAGSEGRDGAAGQDLPAVSIERLPFVQSDEWDRRNGLGPNATQDIYSDSNCCYCFRKTKPDAVRLTMIRTHDGNWWLIAPTAPIRNDEWDRFALPVGPDCLRRHPEWKFAIAERTP